MSTLAVILRGWQATKIDLTPAVLRAKLYRIYNGNTDDLFRKYYITLGQIMMSLRESAAETPVMSFFAKRRSTVPRSLTSGESYTQNLQDISTPIPHQS